MKLKGKHLAYLRSASHHLKPYIVIGKTGLSDSSVNSIINTLAHHELIKIKVLYDDKDDIINILVNKIKCVIVGSIGKILIIYKESPDEEKRKIKFPFWFKKSNNI